MNEWKTQRGKVTKNLNYSQMLGSQTLEYKAEQKLFLLAGSLRV